LIPASGAGGRLQLQFEMRPGGLVGAPERVVAFLRSLARCDHGGSLNLHDRHREGDGVADRSAS
jgi:hypothetical protein